MEEHEYESLEQMRGSMSLRKSPDPAAFERGNYMKVLRSWKVSRVAAGRRTYELTNVELRM